MATLCAFDVGSSAAGPGPQPDIDPDLLSADLAGAQGLPTQLGNGIWSVASTPSGAAAAPTYVAGLMDYTPGDVSRPAAVPGWSGIDVRWSPATGAQTPAKPAHPSGPWASWAPLDAAHFGNYRQQLDLRAATLTTQYRYADGHAAGQVEFTQLVSRAEPHLGTVRLRVTPDFDGVVELRFPLVLWAPHEPRLPLAQLSGPEMEEALVAHGLDLQPHPPAVVDRAAIWYPGTVRIEQADLDTSARTLAIRGHAVQGAAVSLAMAADVAAPAAVQRIEAERSPWRLALHVWIPVRRGTTYEASQYVSLSRDGWGAGAPADLAAARGARERGFEALLRAHRAAWAQLWAHDIRIDGDARAQQAVRAEQYYLLANVSESSPFGIGPCGLATCYAGHAFWDSDSWIMPALLLQHPALARNMLAFRERTLPQAQARARAHGLPGAMYPWEADPGNGTDQTPFSAHVLAETEIHVNADVALAQWQYYLASGDRAWLAAQGWPVLREVARYLASRVTRDPVRGNYSLEHVTSVAETHPDIRNDTFTNLGAEAALRAAVAAAGVLGETPEPRWEQVARGLRVPTAADGSHHLAYEAGTRTTEEDFGGGPLPLLFLPALDLQMTPDMRRADYAVSAGAPRVQRGAVSMGVAPLVIAAASVGAGADAVDWLRLNFTGGTLKAPFLIRTETAGNNTGEFLTGSGGFVQSLVFGLSGLRLRPAGLEQAYAPVLPPEWRGLTLRGVEVRGRVLDIRILRSPDGSVRVVRSEPGPVEQE